ncbi:hypothetical protein H6F67_26130 [Microcoleus sp. FACHB-1515]|uniref:hypothetical protein n=1 Tax=Cyanophyceae TaxID=3028117 RepID=UPI001687AF27|nr:hypothetical protein [Microcoleus sp. FACHB-1515]MBD2093328.1 hypothetical protein [Microcoleus sp. FACHB-1515]
MSSDFSADWEAQEQFRHRRLLEQLRQELRSQKATLPPQSSLPVASAEPKQPAPPLPERSVQSQKPGKRRIIYEER